MLNFDSWVFDNKSSEEFGLLRCTFDKPSGVQDGGDVSEIQYSLTSTLINGKWRKNGNSHYETQPKYEITAMFNDFSNMDSYDIGAIRRWLCRKDGFHTFSIVKGDHFDVQFEVMIPSVKTKIVNGEVVGITFTIQCNAPYGFSHLVKTSVDTSESNTIKIPDMSEEIGYIYPNIRIDVNKNCNISIKNSLEPTREFVINNCVAGEVITINGDTLQLETTAINRDIYNNCNFKFPRIINEYNKCINVFTIQGDCEIQMEYRPIRKVTV